MKNKLNKIVLFKPFLAISALILMSIALRFIRFYDFITFGHDNSRDNIVSYKMFLYHEYIYVGPVFSVVWGYMSPIYYYILYPFYLLFGFSPVAAPVASIVANIITLILVSFVAYKFYGKAAAFIAALVFGVSVYIIKLGSEGLNPSLMLPFTVLAFYSYIEWLKTSREKFLYWFAFGLSFVTALHPAGFFLLVPLFILYFFYKPKLKIVSGIIASCIYGLLGVVPYLIQEKKLAWWTFKQLIAYLKHHDGPEIGFFAMLTNYFYAILKNISLTLFNSTSLVPVIIAGIVLVFIFYEAFIFFKNKNESTVLAFTLALYILVFGFIVKFENSDPHSKWLFAAFIPLLVLYISSLLARLYRTNYWYTSILIVLGLFIINIHSLVTIPYEDDSYSYMREVTEVIRNDSNGENIDIYGGNPEPIYYMLWFYETDPKLKEQYFTWIKWAKERDANKAYYVEQKSSLGHNESESIKDKNDVSSSTLIHTSDIGKKIYKFE